jgi:endoglucanase
MHVFGLTSTAGFEFGVDTNGSASGYAVPPSEQIEHFADQGINVFRLPFGWQYMQPTLGGNFDAEFATAYDGIVRAILATGSQVIIDVHNYARWNGGIIGQGGPSNAQFVDLWKRLATAYAGEPAIKFGLMNEPHDLDMVLCK